jgi:hypothetical protein
MRGRELAVVCYFGRVAEGVEEGIEVVPGDSGRAGPGSLMNYS